jgi:mutator protein MutT
VPPLSSCHDLSVAAPRVAKLTLTVVAAVVERGGCFLVTRRQPGVHLEGYWEFPGGKCEAAETHDGCLRREILEELGVSARVGALLLETSHDYADRTLRLYFYRCEIDGDPQPLLKQDITWATRTELGTLDFPPADAELIRILRSGAPLQTP